MDPAIVIRTDDGAGVFYEARDHADRAVGRSTKFASICKLEESLGALYRTRADNEPYTCSIQSGVTTLRFGSGRRAFCFQGALEPQRIDQLLKCVADGHLMDARAPERRRTDLSQASCRIEL
jgi:hypothetical protein